MSFLVKPSFEVYVQLNCFFLDYFFAILLLVLYSAHSYQCRIRYNIVPTFWLPQLGSELSSTIDNLPNLFSEENVSLGLYFLLYVVGRWLKDGIKYFNWISYHKPLTHVTLGQLYVIISVSHVIFPFKNAALLFTGIKHNLGLETSNNFL